MSRAGLKPKQRKLATTVRKEAKRGKLTANQWQNTPQQNDFMQAWLEPVSPTYGNAYQSALKVGYSPKYANQIVSRAIDNKWIQEFTRLTNLQPVHIIQGIQKEAIDAKGSSDRLRAYELLGKLQGMFVDRQHTQIDVHFTNSVPRPIKTPSTVVDTPKS